MENSELRQRKGLKEDEEAIPFPPTYIVMQVSKRIKTEAVYWLIDKIKKPKLSGGANLMLKAQTPVPGERVTFHVTATNIKLLELAEELELLKKDRQGVLREFTLDDIDEFTHEVDADHLLTTSEKQVLIRHELDNIRALAHENYVPGYPSFTLYEGQSVFSVCLHHGIVKQMFPLHEPKEVGVLQTTWCQSILTPQPFDSVREYFGESVTLYFHFLDFFTKSLIPPMLLGLLQSWLYPIGLPYFCIANIICATLFTELWRRKCSELAYLWGTITMSSLDEPRPNFKGILGRDVSGKLFPQYPRWKTNVKMYLVSLPLVFIWMTVGFIIMLASFRAESWIRSIPDIHPWYKYIPGTVYAIIVCALNLIYRPFATFLTEWENHRTQSQFDRHRVTKLVLFEFVNNFMSLFYVAFIIQDIKLLRSTLATMLCIQLVVNNIIEYLYPLVSQHFKKTQRLKKRADAKNKVTPHLLGDLPGVAKLDEDDPRVQQALNEAEKEPYEDPYDDYLELFILFGYVFLFTAVFPLGAIFAVVNNFIEIRLDGYKLCALYQRPMARKVKDTGAWKRAFQFLCALSIMTNCAFLCLTPSLREASPNFSPVEWVMVFVLIEHLLLGFRQILHFAIHDKPEWVKVELAQGNLESRRALKLQRLVQKKSKTS